VTVAARPAVKDNFAFLQTNFTRAGFLDRDEAFGQVRGSLFDIASFTPGAASKESLDAILKPVSSPDFASFSNNTSFGVVKNSFAVQFNDFGNFFFNFFN
jgi:hypothetical protein